ncbi:flagellar protein FlaG [Motiliproteus sediminis]|uniref:flagellar protein FlaG n=1 Tax=Motiliproteus sediminis TaxID=1468178 RepID=UPI001AF00866|nr:flagellar protein FlaG [Motiliproteus sediminis]
MSSDITIPSNSGSTPSPRSTPAATPEVQGSSSAPSTRADIQRRVEQTQETQEISQERMERLVDQINEFAAQMSRNLNFSVDDPTGHTVITVTEKGSGELVRKIPSEEFLALSRHIQDMNNLLFKEKV